MSDDAYAIVTPYAKMRRISVGKAISELVVRGSQARVPLKQVNGLVIFDPPADSPILTNEQVKSLEDER